MNYLCYEIHPPAEQDMLSYQKEDLSKAYRLLFNYLDKHPNIAENLQLTLVHPKYVDVLFLKDTLSEIYTNLQLSADPWIIHFLQVFSAHALFAPKNMLTCPNITSKLVYMYNY